MKFRTEYEVKKSIIALTPEAPVALVGSCFSDNIAMKMRESLWDARNPLGALYNPRSIATALKTTLLSMFAERDFERSLFLKDDKYYSYYFDSKLSAYLAADVMSGFAGQRTALWEAVAKGRCLIVTFGTARTYVLKEKGITVGNCHKLNPALFEHRMLGVEEISREWNNLISGLRLKFPDLKLIFTVSPVRHLKDGFHENALSKSTLLMAIDEIVKDKEYASYFPAYEILLDDLRDYRFYASDLLHPSDEAVEYIWDKFKDTYLGEREKEILKEGERLRKRINHRPLPDCTTLVPDEVAKARDAADEEIQKCCNAFSSRFPGMLNPRQ